MKNRTKKVTVITVILLLTAAAMGVASLILLKRENAVTNGITRAEAAKMIASARAGQEELASKEGKNWYDKYVSYVNETGYMNITKPEGNLTYGDLNMFLQKMGVSFEEMQIVHGKDKEAVKKNDFVNLYIDLIKELDPEGTVRMIETGIVGTPSNIADAKAWHVYTTKGILNFEGLILDYAIDQTVSLIIKDSSILCVQRVVEDSVDYRNVWVESGSKNTLKVYAYGVSREFAVEDLSEEISAVLADIHIVGKTVTGVSIKTDTIKGKVLSITNEYVEVEGYGRVPMDPDYKIYNNYNGFSIKNYTDIIVGYALQDFIVADGEICGAVISQPLNADNIRVLIKTNGFDSLFHDTVTLTSSQDFTLYYNESEERHGAGEVITIDRNSPYLSNGRVRMAADAEGKIAVSSITRAQGTPSYEGSIEVSVSDSGLLITNEVLMEKYLKTVVPSEMPSSYGVEALKVQAICARSYAYKHLTNSGYGNYGAHVDDSTQYQVYNNINETENSNKAIAETDGEVITHNGEVVQTYYYSTSCGYTTDVSLWGSNPQDYPYFVSRAVSHEEKVLDMANEETFAEFIKNSSPTDFDKDFPLYRWKWEVSIDELSNALNSKLGERIKAFPTRILVRNAAGNFVRQNINSIGQIISIEQISRVAGGAITSLVAVGTEGAVKIDGENNIRYLFGVSGKPLTTATGGSMTMSSMPSTFCVFEKIHEGEAHTGYRIIGGGYGHGIGMSQNAVYGMTNRDWKYNEIIEFFYNGVSVEKRY